MLERKQYYYCTGIIILAIFLCYCHTFNAPFIFDDAFLIEEIEGKSAYQLMLPYSGLRPFYKVSFALNYYISGIQTWSYHLFNILIHIINSLLIFNIIRYSLLMQCFHGKFNKSAIWISFITALIWGIHPLQTQAVTYISQRCEIMMVMFYLFALLALIKSSAGGKYSYIWQISTLFFFLLGLGSKEAMISAPIILLLYDRIFLSTSIKEICKKRYIIYSGFLLIVLFPVIYLLIVGRLFHYIEDINGLNMINSYRYLLTQSEIVMHYIKLSIIPYPLSFNYNWTLKSNLNEVIVPITLFVIALFFLIYWVKKNIFLTFPLLFFIINLAPRSTIVISSHLAVEYRMYLPLIGLILFYVVGIFLLLKEDYNQEPLCKQRDMNQKPIIATQYWKAIKPTCGIKIKTPLQKTFFPSILAMYLITLAIITIRQNNLYNTPLFLWRENVHQTPNNFNALNYYGIELSKNNRFIEAKSCFQKALLLQPNHLVALNNLANIHFEMGDYKKAISLYYQSLETYDKDKELLNKFNRITHHNLGKIFTLHKNYPKAIFHYKKALSLDPDNSILIDELNVLNKNERDK